MRLHPDDLILFKKGMGMKLNHADRLHLRRERYRARRAVEKTAMLERRLHDLRHVKV
jgi:hypothetical protein